MVNKISLLLAFVILSSFNTPIIHNDENLFDETSILDDFESSIDVNQYLDVEHATLVDFYEYMYGSDSFDLYLYVSLPNNIYIDYYLNLNKISLSVGNFDYIKYNLEILDIYHNIVKFKIDFSKSEKDDLISKIISSPLREYKISGIELLETGNVSATDFKIGGEFIYSGYAKGINDNDVSTLKREYVEIETLDLDVNQTYYRFNTSIDAPLYGYNEKTQIDSVYFSIPNYYLEKYGEVSNIQAEYYEYRTSPILVLRDDVYETFKNYVGIDIDDITNPGYAICYYSPNTTGQLAYYTYYERNQVLNNVKGNYPFYYSPYITWLFKGGSDGKDKISGDEIKDYLYSYDKSYFEGSNYKGLSNDLINGTVDENHKRGYNLVNISSEDNENLLIFSGNAWERFFTSWFNNVEIELPLIEKIENVNSVDDLYINEDDVDDFKDYVNNARNLDGTTYLFRFSSSNYYSQEIYDKKYSDILFEGVDGYLASETIYLDFDIISLTFERNGMNTIIPAISNPIDVIAGVIPPDTSNIFESLGSLLKIIMGIAIVILLVVGLYFIFNLLGISFKDIINFLFVKPFKWIGSKFKSKKKNKNIKLKDKGKKK